MNLLCDLEKALYFWTSDLASASPDAEWKWGRGGRRKVQLDLLVLNFCPSHPNSASLSDI